MPSPSEVHRVRAKLASGAAKQYHYAWRGGPRFWTSDDGVKVNSPEYFAALAACVKPRKTAETSAADLIDTYLDSAEYRSLRDRTRADYLKWALRLADEFRDDPAAIFEEPESRGEVADWRAQWVHSPKQYDYAGTVTTAILNWAVDLGKIRVHHCHRMRKVYAADRAEIVWTPGHEAAIRAIAPEWVKRILTAALETGLRREDLVNFGWQHVEEGARDRMVRVRTRKTGKVALVPVTPRLGALLDATPRDRMRILVNARGDALTPHRASEGVRQWRDKAGLPSDLRLNDCRGTAATRLLRAGASLEQLARAFGWSLRTAQGVIERYAAVSTDEAHDVLVLLERARNKE